MEMLRQRVPLWSPSADTLAARIRAAADGAVRILDEDDAPALRRLLDAEPISSASVVTTLEARGGAGPADGRGGPLFLGIDAETRGGAAGELAAACWVGSNINPVGADEHAAERFGLAIGAMRRRVSSIYGPSAAVLELFDAAGWRSPRDIRGVQPLMATDRTPDVAPLPGVRPALPEDFDVVEPACAAMFTEELGFSPYRHGAAGYQERIRRLIADGHAMVLLDPVTGEVVFKAEFGAVTDHVVQVQGVWVRPADRGRGLSAPGMAAVVEHGLQLAPTVSLYVNSYNAAALRTYRKVGFEQVGTFSTILF